MIKKILACNKMNFSSNIKDIISAVLNSLFIYFFYKKILHALKAPKAQKSTKSTKTQKHNQAKVQNANKQTKIKNALKNI